MTSLRVGVALVCLCLCLSVYAASPMETDALNELYRVTNGRHWDIQDGWDTTADACTWFGVECNAMLNVTGIALGNNSLKGSLYGVPFQTQLPSLTSIDISSNDVDGPMPPLPTSIYALSIKYNRGITALPTNLCDMTQLAFAHMDFCGIEGSLPSCVGTEMTSLQVLGLTDNNLSGELPSGLATNAALETLQLGGNQFSGEIPPFGAESLSLSVLDLSSNSLSGSIPSSLDDCPNLIEADVQGNALSGTLSPSFSHGLVVADARDNTLGGTLTCDMLDNSLQYLLLSGNSLSGHLPSDECLEGVTIPVVDVSNNPFLCPVSRLAEEKLNAECTYLFTPAEITVYIDDPALTFPVHTGMGLRYPIEEGLTCRFLDTGLETRAILTPNEMDYEFPTLTCPTSSANGIAPVGEELEILYQGTRVSTGTVQVTLLDPYGIPYEMPGAKAAEGERDPVALEVYGMSKCPDYSSIVLEVMTPLREALGDDIVQFTVGFIADSGPAYASGFWSLHGQTEAIGDEATLCAQDILGVDAYLPLAECLYEDIEAVPSNLHQCLQDLYPDQTEDVLACTYGQDSRDMMTDSYTRANTLRANWSPTAYIDGDRYCLWHSDPCPAQDWTDFAAQVGIIYTLSLSVSVSVSVPPQVCEAYGEPVPIQCLPFLRVPEALALPAPPTSLVPDVPMVLRLCDFWLRFYSRRNKDLRTLRSSLRVRVRDFRYVAETVISILGPVPVRYGPSLCSEEEQEMARNGTKELDALYAKGNTLSGKYDGVTSIAEKDRKSHGWVLPLEYVYPDTE
ncbi:gamma interferon inducible lysosomal thiol reductase GILT [Kipferlia bialata]|uniref:Gamma interferon inducible lysosomal thiol reductase GILT n=1 Tax=Kipferlia bialata TaxID=797122 RepID=A0A9K3CWL3_9EUKA|nr:gamma interferon inducible lysosomal thiol reductase GILT [Kipferlia bialata]|eukprot:g5017.t1